MLRYVRLQACLLVMLALSTPAVSWPGGPVGPIASQVAQAQATETAMTQALREHDVYVAPAARARVSEADEAELQRLAQRLGAAGHPLKLAVLDRPPSGFQTLGDWVDAAHGALRLGDGILVAVAMDAGGGSGSVSAKTDAVDKATIERIQQKDVGAFLTVSYAEGLRVVTQDVIAEIEAQRAAERSRGQLLRALLLAGLALVLVTIGVLRGKQWARETAALASQRASLYPLLRRLDDELPYVAGTPDGTRASELQADGAEPYNDGSLIADRLASVPIWRGAMPGAHWRELDDATRAFERARQHLADAVVSLDRALVTAESRSNSVKSLDPRAAGHATGPQ